MTSKERIVDHVNMILKESIVDHVPDTDSTGRSPMEDEGGSSPQSSLIDESQGDEVKERQPQESEVPNITAKEDVAVNTFKCMIVGLIAMCAVGISSVIYVFLNGSENDAFASTYESYAFQVLDSVGMQLDQNMATLDTFNLGVLSYATASGSQWPFVTLPDSATHLSKIRAQTKASDVSLLSLLSDGNREAYENYTMMNYEWVNETLLVQKSDSTLPPGVGAPDDVLVYAKLVYDGTTVPADSGPYAATWQGYPLFESYPPFNVDILRNPELGPAIETAILDRSVVLTNVQVNADEQGSDGSQEPLSSFIFPIYQDDISDAVAVTTLAFYWGALLQGILRVDENGLVVVVQSTCSQAFTYQINGPDAVFLGPKDLHDNDFDEFEIKLDLSDLLGTAYTGIPLDEDYCSYSILTYPSEELEDGVKTIMPLIFTLAAICVFVFAAVLFVVYDMLVAYRQEKVLKAAQQSNAIVSSLFPETVRDRLFKKVKGGKSGKKSKDKRNNTFEPAKSKMRNFLSSDRSHDSGGSLGDLDMMDAEARDRPIADLFPETTILFADIAGFTAWSSVREPSQVFTLLEKIYAGFDRIAIRRGVFKVETIGDSYVAVVGLPEPRADHAVVMVKFADQCRNAFSDIVRELEFSLGPETSDLKMRFGLNSGPTTAGVLRGQKSRFQLFGDTVNTAARMESTGKPNHIHVSQATADLLIAAKKEHWLEARPEKVDVKGKGPMQTYFAEPLRGGNSLSSSIHSAGTGSTMAEAAHKNERMVYWCTDIMARLLRQIAARRESKSRAGAGATFGGSTIASLDGMGFDDSTHDAGNTKRWKKTGMVIEEVVEVIHLPEFDASMKEVPESEITIPQSVMKQLREFVTEIAGTYRENPFHNFEHASHVVMSVAKLLSRIVAPDKEFTDDASNDDILLSLHDYTYGITSDPLTQFACVFAALIHDVDHYGIPNSQLIEEKAPLASRYKNRSPAEQNSVNIAWKILMKSQFASLRGYICPTDDDMCRFRQLVVNSVMATDIADKDMKALRNARWAKAFSDQVTGESERTNINRKATIVIEHLIQASDVAHTMQHWHVYTKWNERLFQEMSLAYLVGRSDKDPVEFWYKGELGFFDFYIIPLAKKLSDCGVFGVSSDEYLNYATRNREEWERRGQEILQGMIQRFQEKIRIEYGDIGQLSGGGTISTTSSIASTSFRE